MSNNILQNKPFINVNNTTSSIIKLLVFEIESLSLALPVKQVQKVIRQTEVHGSGLSYVNLSHLEDQEVTIVDLYRKLFKVSQPTNNSKEKGYFIITKNITSEPLGIMVNKTPTLIDVLVEQVRTLPNSYRRADTLEIASHVAVIPQDKETALTIFILDLDRLIGNNITY
jgi:purine-binding chemotaxis protein CheW